VLSSPPAPLLVPPPASPPAPVDPGPGPQGRALRSAV